MTVRREVALGESFDPALCYYVAGENLDASYRCARHGVVLSAKSAHSHHFENSGGRVERKKIVSVHIPKCAGTSIRTQIIKCDPDHISLEKVSKRPTLGEVDCTHIPLSQRQELSSEYYEQVVSLDSFAMVRDPLSRFGSALKVLATKRKAAQASGVLHLPEVIEFVKEHY